MDEIAMMLGMVPDADQMKQEDALKLALKRDQEAATNLYLDWLEEHAVNPLTLKMPMHPPILQTLPAAVRG